MNNLDQAFDLQHFADGQSDQGGGNAPDASDPIARNNAIKEQMGVGKPSDTGKEPEKKVYSFIENGKKVELQLTDQEVLEFVAKGHDYTKKTQTISEERAALTARQKQLDEKLDKLLEEDDGTDDLFDDTPSVDVDALVAKVNALEEKTKNLETESTTNNIKSHITSVSKKYDLNDEMQMKVAKFGDEKNITDFEVAFLAYKGANPNEFGERRNEGADALGAITPGGGVGKQSSDFATGYLKSLVQTAAKERNL